MNCDVHQRTAHTERISLSTFRRHRKMPNLGFFFKCSVFFWAAAWARLNANCHLPQRKSQHGTRLLILKSQKLTRSRVHNVISATNVSSLLKYHSIKIGNHEHVIQKSEIIKHMAGPLSGFESPPAITPATFQSEVPCAVMKTYQICYCNVCTNANIFGSMDASWHAISESSITASWSPGLLYFVGWKLLLGHKIVHLDSNLVENSCARGVVYASCWGWKTKHFREKKRHFGIVDLTNDGPK